MLQTILKKVFGSHGERQLKKYWPLVEEIGVLESEMQAKSEAELRALTDKFREQYRREKAVAVTDLLREGRDREWMAKRLMELAEQFLKLVESDPLGALELLPEEHILERQFKKEGGDEADLAEKVWKRYLKQKFEALRPMLAEAFAAVREAARRTLNMRHFDVQLIGGIVLFDGAIAEMVTGEGKTLVATLPAYLIGLTGEGVHVVTVNDYLARRDAEWMGPIYQLLGLSVGAIQHDMPPDERKGIYACDITYGTNNEFGFDYLRDNMALHVDFRVQRKLNYAIVDEVDSILIDEARTPLIISGAVERQQSKYAELVGYVRNLHERQNRQVKAVLGQARKLLEEEEKRQEGLEKLWQVRACSPKHPDLLSILEDGSVQRDLLKQVDRSYQKEDKARLKEEALYWIEDNERDVILNPEAWNVLFPGHADEYRSMTQEEIEECLNAIDADVELSEEQKFEKRQELQERINDHVIVEENVRQLLRAFTLYRRDVEYVVKDGQVVIVDEFTGRLMPGRRWSDGLHEAVEAKEGVKIQRQNQTLATITLQNYFRLYDRLAGMTGTAYTEAGEFKEIYGLEVVQIPTNRPLIRDNFPDQVYRTEREKYNAVIEDITDCHERGQPLLVGTASIEHSEKLSTLLKRKKIPHEVLNAKNHAREAEIIAQAGASGHVTISTNMAGRGTDILLGGNPDGIAHKMLPKEQEPTEEEIASAYNVARAQCKEDRETVIEAGGLHVIGTERHESRRVDNQLRGRSGRQGDPGSSCFYLSMEDDLMRLFGGDRLKAMADRFGMEEGQVLEHGLVTKSIERAQRNVEGANFERRKYVLKYDDAMKRQREYVYTLRRDLLEGDDPTHEILDMAANVCEQLVRKHGPGEESDEWNFTKLLEGLIQHFGIFEVPDVQLQGPLSDQQEAMHEALVEKVRERFTQRTERLGKNDPRGAEGFFEACRLFMLQIIDKNWKEHLLNMDNLRDHIGLRGYAQVDPLIEYNKEAYNFFEEMFHGIDSEVCRGVFTYEPTQPRAVAPSRRRPMPIPAAARGRARARDGEAVQPVQTVRRKTKKIKPNEPCPCGSGKKYKKCCGKV